MKTTVEDLTSVKKKLMIEINAEEVEKRVDKTFRDYGKKAKIKGFRPGKIPRKILENYFGKQIIEEVADSLVRETLPKALDETKLLPLNIPLIENEVLKKGSEYHYSAIMEVKPEFDLAEYKGIEVEKEICSITDEDVTKQLEAIREANAILNPLSEKRGIREGDYVVVDYEGKDDNGPIEGIKGQNFSLIVGKKRFYPDVEDALVGREKGESFTKLVEFEDDYFHTKLAGKRVTFDVQIIEVKEVKLPELDEELFKKLGEEVQNLDELKQKIRESLLSREEKRINKQLKERLLDKIAKKADFELPESLVDAETTAGIESVKQNLVQAGSDFEKSGLDEEKLREEFRPISEKKVKNFFILGEIAKQNDLQVSDQDIEEGFNEISKEMGYDPAVLRRYYEANNMMDSYRQSLLKEKTLNYLVENAKVVEVNAEKIPRAT
ncbi:MAG: trigger factor [Deltaproteobacteria bacterium]|nr:trigger factor [Deltaproteobacteria bacterium]